MFKRATAVLSVIAASVLVSIPHQAYAQSKAEIAQQAVALGVQIVQAIGVSDSGVVRHVYNTSHRVWKLTGSPGSGLCEQGCGIAPGETIPIYYSQNSGWIDVQSANYHDKFSLIPAWQKPHNCGAAAKGPYIDHNGNTGKAWFNDGPKDGTGACGDIDFGD